jgi:outer membrane biosynthesis protein TonB
MAISIIRKNGKWKINDVDGITFDENREKQIISKVMTPELKTNLIELVKPVFPLAAKAVRAFGEVKVEIVVDEAGKVASAKAILGHPLLRTASEQAALKSTFSPIMTEGKPVKTSGIIIYTFNQYEELYSTFPNTCCK